VKHTPGPWKVNATPHSSNQNFVVLDSGTNGSSKRVCAVYSDNDEADARLIAAAPEQNEACEALIAWIDSGDKGFPDEALLNKAVKKARAALAKVRGQS
jgi:hypothetical protein